MKRSMKNRLLSILIAVTMIISTMPMTAIAAEKDEIKDIYTLKDYERTVCGKEKLPVSGIRLMNDLDISDLFSKGNNDMILVDRDFTIDLNGHKLTVGNTPDKYNGAGHLKFIGVKDSTITVKNGEIITNDDDTGRSGKISTISLKATDPANNDSQTPRSFKFILDGVTVQNASSNNMMGEGITYWSTENVSWDIIIRHSVFRNMSSVYFGVNGMFGAKISIESMSAYPCNYLSMEDQQNTVRDVLGYGSAMNINGKPVNPDTPVKDIVLINGRSREPLGVSESKSKEIWNLDDYGKYFQNYRDDIKDVKLMADLDISSLNTAGNKDMIPVNGDITLDLNGHTLYVATDSADGGLNEWGCLKFHGVSDGIITLKNGTISTTDNFSTETIQFSAEENPESKNYKMVLDGVSINGNKNSSQGQGYAIKLFDTDVVSFKLIIRNTKINHYDRIYMSKYANPDISIESLETTHTGCINWQDNRKLSEILAPGATLTLNGIKQSNDILIKELDTRLYGNYEAPIVVSGGETPLERITSVSIKQPSLPKAGEKPPMTLQIPAKARYNFYDMTWTDVADNHILTGDEVFEYGHTYRLQMNFTSDIGYEFDAGNMNATYNKLPITDYRVGEEGHLLKCYKEITIKDSIVEAPCFYPGGGETEGYSEYHFVDGLNIQIYPIDGEEVYYTTDRSIPTVENGIVTNGTRYTKPIIIDKSTFMKAISVKNGVSSPVTSVYYIKNHRTELPIFNTKGGNYIEEVSVELRTLNKKAKIYYTLDGSEPNENSTLYEGPFTLGLQNGAETTHTVTAIACVEGMPCSYPVKEVFVIRPRADAPIIVQDSKQFKENFFITMEANDPDATIYFTKTPYDPNNPLDPASLPDPRDPNSDRHVYAERASTSWPEWIDSNCIIRAASYVGGKYSEEISEATYIKLVRVTIKNELPGAELSFMVNGEDLSGADMPMWLPQQTQITMSATAPEGYRFTEWNKPWAGHDFVEGDQYKNPAEIYLYNDNATYKPLFAKEINKVEATIKAPVDGASMPFNYPITAPNDVPYYASVYRVFKINPDQTETEIKEGELFEGGNDYRFAVEFGASPDKMWLYDDATAVINGRTYSGKEVTISKEKYSQTLKTSVIMHCQSRNSEDSIKALMTSPNAGDKPTDMQVIVTDDKPYEVKGGQVLAWAVGDTYDSATAMNGNFEKGKTYWANIKFDIIRPDTYRFADAMTAVNIAGADKVERCTVSSDGSYAEVVVKFEIPELIYTQQPVNAKAKTGENAEYTFTINQTPDLCYLLKKNKNDVFETVATLTDVSGNTQKTATILSKNATSEIFRISSKYGDKWYDSNEFTIVWTDSATQACSGTITSAEKVGKTITVSLYREGEKEAAYTTTTETNKYSLPEVEDGNYIMKVSKDGHVTREYAITVSGNPVQQDAEIHLLGDLNGDNKITVSDLKIMKNHIMGIKLLEGYKKLCGDINSSNSITVSDLKMMKNHIMGIKLLW